MPEIPPAYATIAVAVLTLIVGPWVNARMKTQGDAQQSRRDEIKSMAANYDRLERRYIALRELFERLKNECLRTLDNAILRLESGHQSERVAQLLEALKTRIESFKLPELEENEPKGTPKND